MDFERKCLLKGIERKKSTKKEGKEYTILILEDSNGRTLDFFHDGIFTAEVNKVHTFLFEYAVSFGRPQMVITGVK